MKRFLLIFIFIFGYVTLHGQTVIAKQSFETSGDTWTPLNFSTPPCTMGKDVWDYAIKVKEIVPNDGSQFWGIRDLDGSCGGNGFETITFPNVTVSSFNDVLFTFDYYAKDFDNGEDLKYELFFDNVSQGEVIVVDGVGGKSDNTNGWITETVFIPSSITTVSVVLSAKCNNDKEIAGFDNVRLLESTLLNGFCSNAIDLTVGTNNTENVVTTSNEDVFDSGELPEPNCANYNGGDVWFTATIPSSGILTIETLDAGGINNTGLAVYTGSCGNLTLIDCDDKDGPGNFSVINITNLPNTQVYIRAWEKGNDSFGNFNIVAYSPPTPDNNDCNNAQSLIVGSDNTQNIASADNTNASDSGELPEPNCAGYNGGDVWFTAIVPSSGILTIETLDAGGINNTGLAVYTGNCGNLTLIDCDDKDGPGNFSVLNINNLPNTQVYIRAWEKGNNRFGNFNIVAYSPKCPFMSTWNGNSWNNGIPSEFTSVIINGNYDTASNGSFDSCDCTINTGNTVNVRAGNYIQVENDLTVNGTLEVRHEGSLVMVQDNGIVTSPGITNIHKTTTPFNDPLDYTYWSSPTMNETFGSALVLSRADRIFEFDIVSGWIAKSGTDIMQTAEGYLAGAPSAGIFPQSQSVVFDGVVNNGIIKTSAFQAINFNWNFIGNPYPSAIDADLFLDDPLNTSIVNGTIYLWTHNTPISEANPGNERYNYSVSDYATYTAGIGGTAAVSGGAIPNGFIASTQGFFAQGLTNGEATFNNSMRITTNNNQLFKTATTSNEKDRIWLNLYNNKGAFSQILIGFIENGTDGIDRYDGSKFGGNYISFYSIIEDDFFSTQSKPTIKNKETIKLGLYSYLEEGDSLKISIENIEGQLTNYNIYLKDKLLNLAHDLNIEDYIFIPEPQSFYDDRFELLLIKSHVLDTDEITSTKDELLVSQFENSVEIKTTNTSTINQLRIYDLLGKTIINTKPNTTLYSLNTNSIPKGTILLLSIILDTTEVLTRKVIIY